MIKLSRARLSPLFKPALVVLLVLNLLPALAQEKSASDAQLSKELQNMFQEPSRSTPQAARATAAVSPSARISRPIIQSPSAQFRAPRSGRQLRQDYTDQIMSGGTPRQFHVHLPRLFDRKRALPVVLVYHGLHLNGKIMKAISMFDQTADRNGFAVVYPDGVGNRFSDGFTESGVDDVAFTADLLNRLGRTINVDQRRVYACGLSNGGYMAQKLACDLSDRIAAIGVVASSAFEQVCSRCRSTRAVPVIYFLGTEDPLVHREGQAKELGELGEAIGLGNLGTLGGSISKMGGLLSAQEAVDFWVRHNGCSSTPRSALMPDASPGDGCRVRRDIYGGGSYGSEVAVYTIEGGGHTWPGGLPYATARLAGNTTQDVSASELMWGFFASHSR